MDCFLGCAAFSVAGAACYFAKPAEGSYVPVELNSCTAEQLQCIPGISGSLAHELVGRRPYCSMREVLEVVEDAGVSRVVEEFCWLKPNKVATAGQLLQAWETVQVHVPGTEENVVRAWFGDPRYAWQEGSSKGILCTETIKKRMRSNHPVVVSCSCLGGDPAPGVHKQLRVEVSAMGCHLPVDAWPPRVFGSASQSSSPRRWLAFVRHAQAGHNVDRALLDCADNGLTEVGMEQGVRARDGPAGEAIRHAQLVVTSPLMRAMQTVSLLSGEQNCSTRVRVDALCTERNSAKCDEGTAKSILLKSLNEGVWEEFLDWEGWDALQETWWPPRGEDNWQRARAFVKMARERPEDRIVFVGHGAFWDTVLGHYLDNCQVVYTDRDLNFARI